MESHIWVFEAVSQGSCFKLCKLRMNEHVGLGLNGIFDMKNGIIKGFFPFRMDILLVLKYTYNLRLNRGKT